VISAESQMLSFNHRHWPAHAVLARIWFFLARPQRFVNHRRFTASRNVTVTCRTNQKFADCSRASSRCRRVAASHHFEYFLRRPAQSPDARHKRCPYIFSHGRRSPGLWARSMAQARVARVVNVRTGVATDSALRASEHREVPAHVPCATRTGAYQHRRVRSSPVTIGAHVTGRGCNAPTACTCPWLIRADKGRCSRRKHLRDGRRRRRKLTIGYR
jgi:hypothetical protein